MKHAILFYLWIAISAHSQEPARRLEFEVASIKPAAPPAMSGGGGFIMRTGIKVTGTRMDYVNASVRDLIRTAYGLKDYQITAPEWMAAARFDIEAKLPEGAGREQVPKMLQSLLEDRFKLAAHLTKDERDVYALVVGKNGPKLKATDPDARNGADLKAMSEADLKAAAESMAKRGTVAMSRMQGGNTVSFGTGGGNATIHSLGVTLGQLADSLTRYVDRPVLDATGIEGKYDFTLEVPPGSFMTAAGMESQMRAAMGAAGMSAGTAASDPSGASVFESVQKYGLKLEKRKAPIDMLVVDSAEKAPTEN